MRVTLTAWTAISGRRSGDFFKEGITRNCALRAKSTVEINNSILVEVTRSMGVAKEKISLQPIPNWNIIQKPEITSKKRAVIPRGSKDFSNVRSFAESRLRRTSGMMEITR